MNDNSRDMKSEYNKTYSIFSLQYFVDAQLVKNELLNEYKVEEFIVYFHFCLLCF